MAEVQTGKPDSTSNEVLDYILGFRGTGTTVDARAEAACSVLTHVFKSNLSNALGLPGDVSGQPSKAIFSDLSSQKVVFVQMPCRGEHLPCALLINVTDASKLIAASIGFRASSVVDDHIATLTDMEVEALSDAVARLLATDEENVPWTSQEKASVVEPEKLKIFEAGRHAGSRFKIHTDDFEISFSILVPHSWLLEKRAPKDATGTKGGTEESAEVRIPSAMLPISATLEIRSIPFAMLSDLKPGQIITCEKTKNDPVKVRIGSKTAFFGVFGRIGKQNAVKIRNSVPDNA